MRSDQKRVILVTGGAGFIGSNFIHYYLAGHPGDHIINLDKLTYAGEEDHIKEIEQKSNYTFIKGDICDSELVDEIFRTYGVTDIIHFAAESHVDNAISEPDPFIATNINGTYQLLKTAKRHWLEGGRDGETNRFHHISTDEVFGTLAPDEAPFNETSPYAPNNPYSASKAAADMLVRSYCKTYGLNTVITNCSNNYGPRQHMEKFIPTVVRTALKFEHIPLYGDGQQIRDWLYVEDHASAIDLVFHNGKKGEVYHIGGDNERANLELANMICDVLDELAPISSGRRVAHYRDLITFVKDRPGHDRRYAIDPQRIARDLNWRPKTRLEDGIRQTVGWYLENEVL
ncbi:dTDP-glucose 4,6-dehydratase [Scopulibacillus darangshiensis]|uniref:dTDP-glucose 4,6-dehydratase n=1 Tax=Scopulibacillus darangshiensis TaxID=442528 RepID=A0A4R2NF59_9BACL|nr:dTDP-glucose 4,6-dehydratase [Scopulibacillus darangshiensis]TCP19969.1 dTDP-glucose 4,6-dehydratase [Scopulibacillus darangshiensis]